MRNGSATAGATRSHERPVATPAQTDTVTKPDRKRPATSPVIKNAEVKAGKETVRTNIRQKQQVNQKQNRKIVRKPSEKGRKKSEIKAYPYHRYDISCPFLHRPLFRDIDFRRR